MSYTRTMDSKYNSETAQGPDPKVRLVLFNHLAATFFAFTGHGLYFSDVPKSLLSPLSSFFDFIFRHLPLHNRRTCNGTDTKQRSLNETRSIVLISSKFVHTYAVIHTPQQRTAGVNATDPRENKDKYGIVS